MRNIATPPTQPLQTAVKPYVPTALTPPSYPPLQAVTKPFLTTAEIAYYTNTRPQTWRRKACYDEAGPLKPTRLFGKLAWPTSQLRELLEAQ